MAIYNEILSGRFNRALQKIFAIKGKPPVRQLGGEVMPVHALLSGTEANYLEGWTKFAFNLRQRNGGNVTGIRVRNPTGTNVIAVIEQMIITSGAFGDVQSGDSIHVRFGSANTPSDLTPSFPGAGQRLDFRSFSGNAGGSSLVWSRQAVGIVPIVGLQEIGFVAAPTWLTFNYLVTRHQDITLLPGDAIQIDNDAFAVTLSLSLIWRERLLEESERQ